MRFIRDNFLRFFLSFTVIFTSVFSIENDYWWSKWAVLLFGLSIGIGWLVGKRVHWSAGLCVAYSLWNSVYIYAWRPNIYRPNNDFIRTTILSTSMLAACCFLTMAFALYNLKKKDLSFIGQAFGFVAIADTFYVIYQRLDGIRAAAAGGFFDYPGMNACFIAFLIPIVYSMTGLYSLIALMGLAICLSNSTMPLVVMGAMVTWWYLIKPGWKKKALALWAGILVFGIGYALFGKEVFSDAGRFHFLKIAFLWWKQHIPIWIGSGTGTHFVLGPHVQFVNNWNVNALMIWAHNDWFQELFQEGIIGLTLYVNLFICAGIRSLKRGDTTIFITLIAYGVTALGDYPAHLAVHSFFGMWLAVVCFRGGLDFKYTKIAVTGWACRLSSCWRVLCGQRFSKNADGSVVTPEPASFIRE